MPYSYGKEKAIDSIKMFANDAKLEINLTRALSELKVITIQDVSIEHFNKIDSLFKKLINISNLAVGQKPSQGLHKTNNHLILLSEDVIELCVAIIEFNTLHNH